MKERWNGGRTKEPNARSVKRGEVRFLEALETCVVIPYLCKVDKKRQSSQVSGFGNSTEYLFLLALTQPVGIASHEMKARTRIEAVK